MNEKKVKYLVVEGKLYKAEELEGEFIMIQNVKKRVNLGIFDKFPDFIGVALLILWVLFVILIMMKVMTFS